MSKTKAIGCVACRDWARECVRHGFSEPSADGFCGDCGAASAEVWRAAKADTERSAFIPNHFGPQWGDHTHRW